MVDTNKEDQQYYRSTSGNDKLKLITSNREKLMKQNNTHIQICCEQCKTEFEIKKRDLLSRQNFDCPKCSSNHHFRLDGREVVTFYTYHSSVKLKSDCPTCDGGRSGICYGIEAHGNTQTKDI